MLIQTESVKYLGSKLKLLNHIYEIISSLPVKSILDGFSGSTRVSQMLARNGYTIWSNDISYLSQTLGRCYLLHAPYKKEYYIEIINHLNSLKGYEGWFSTYYGGKERDTKLPFQLKNTKKIDAIRNEIDNLGLDKISKSIILTSLILAVDKVDSTLGHFSSYLREWSKRSYEKLYLKLPLKFKVQENHVARQDVFKCLHKEYDLAYYDPPYGSCNDKMPSSRVRYNAYYHFWTTLIKNDTPELFGKVNRRLDTKDNTASVFEEFRKDGKKFIAAKAINKLIKDTNAQYILFSYSSLGRVPKKTLVDIFNTHCKIKKFYEIDYKKNVMAEMKWTKEWNNNKTNKEYLVLLQK